MIPIRLPVTMTGVGCRSPLWANRTSRREDQPPQRVRAGLDPGIVAADAAQRVVEVVGEHRGAGLDAGLGKPARTPSTGGSWPAIGPSNASRRLGSVTTSPQCACCASRSRCSPRRTRDRARRPRRPTSAAPPSAKGSRACCRAGRRRAAPRRARAARPRGPGTGSPIAGTRPRTPRGSRPGPRTGPRAGRGARARPRCGAGAWRHRPRAGRLAGRRNRPVPEARPRLRLGC